MAACRLEAVSSSYLQWAGNPTNRVPVCGETGQWRDFGIACQPRGSWRRSGHSTQTPGVMPWTRGRTAGLWRCPRPCGGGREPLGDKGSRQTKLQAWRAVCAETCKHGFGGGRLETCHKVTRWPSTLPHQGQSSGQHEQLEHSLFLSHSLHFGFCPPKAKAGPSRKNARTVCFPLRV